MKFTTYATTKDGRYSLDLTEIGADTHHIGAYPQQNVENFHLSLGLRCNFSCGHCPINESAEVAKNYEQASKALGVELGDPRNYTRPELLTAALELFPKIEQIGLGCGGGEPMLNPDFENFLTISKGFFAAKAKAQNISRAELPFWMNRPHEYGMRNGRAVDVHGGGRIIVYTNAVRMPQNKTLLKEYLIQHPDITYEVSHDGFHGEMYKRHGRDFEEMIGNLHSLAGDSDVKGSGVQICLLHIGKETPEDVQRAFPNCVVNIAHVIKFGLGEHPGPSTGKKHNEGHAISDSHGNLFYDMVHAYSGYMLELCGKVRKVET